MVRTKGQNDTPTAAAMPRQERRVHPRVPSDLLVTLQHGSARPVPCRVLDASIGGVAVEGEAVLPVGAEITLIMPGSVHFGGRIVRQQGRVMGIAFSQSPERVAAMIADLMPSLGKV